MSEACKHPNWRLSAGLWSSATPVPWTCPDCGGRGTVEIVDSPDQDAPTPQLSALECQLSDLECQLSALESQLSAIGSELLALSSQLLTLGHRLRALGSQPSTLDSRSSAQSSRPSALSQYVTSALGSQLQAPDFRLKPCGVWLMADKTEDLEP